MAICKHCGSEKAVKDGVVKNKQRYRCRSCSKTFRDGDDRQKYTLEQKIKAIKLYTDGVGMMTIERSEGISSPLLIHWIRSFGKILRKAVAAVKIPEDAKKIEILEVDELFTYYQKKHKKPTYGLLLIGTEIKLLILR